jgi:hypothetical protein
VDLGSEDDAWEGALNEMQAPCDHGFPNGLPVAGYLAYVVLFLAGSSSANPCSIVSR